MIPARTAIERLGAAMHALARTSGVSIRAVNEMHAAVRLSRSMRVPVCQWERACQASLRRSRDRRAMKPAPLFTPTWVTVAGVIIAALACWAIVVVFAAVVP